VSAGIMPGSRFNLSTSLWVTCIVKLHFNEDDTIKNVKMTGVENSSFLQIIFMIYIFIAP